MEAHLQQLLSVANDLIPALVESYNSESQEFNELTQELDTAQSKVAEYEATIKAQTHLLIEQKQKLDELTEKHNSVVVLANERIRDLERHLSDAKAELKELKRFDPVKMSKTNQEQKVKLAERLKALDAEKGKNRNLKRELSAVQERLNNQKIGFWRNNQERLIKNLTNKELTLETLSVETTMETMIWWQHECGLKLLFGYDKDTETAYCCDVNDPDTHQLHQPSAQAWREINRYFKENVK